MGALTGKSWADPAQKPLASLAPAGGPVSILVGRAEFLFLAARFAARHPNLVALELSSFKCGHDAPIYTAVEELIEASGTPFFAFKDLDENHPAGSVRIRIETIDHALRRYGASLGAGSAAG